MIFFKATVFGEVSIVGPLAVFPCCRCVPGRCLSAADACLESIRARITESTNPDTLSVLGDVLA